MIRIVCGCRAARTPGGVSVPRPTSAMSVNESCALNLDGTFKAANEIQWVHSPTQGSVQLPGTQSNSNGPAFQKFAVNLGPPTLHTSKQPSSQLVAGKNTKKRKRGQGGGDAKAKRPANEGLGIQRILVEDSMRSGMSPHRT
jgi:hypothetical protein